MATRQYIGPRDRSENGLEVAILAAPDPRREAMPVADVPLPVLPAKPLRGDVPQDKVLCEFCTAKCCRYFALPLETPTTREEFEYIRWFLLHDQATVFTEDGEWYVCVHTVCKHLQDDNRCGIYETRPPVCREYTTKECEYEDDWIYDRYFETPEQVVEYMDSVLGPGGEHVGDGRRRKNRRRSIRGPKPPLLQII
jgi:Fe-S-cluster containining protein